MCDYEFNEKIVKELTIDTESTSAIGTIVYEIYGVTDKVVIAQIENLKDNNQFPPNLKLIDIEYDPDTSFCAAAFIQNI